MSRFRSGVSAAFVVALVVALGAGPAGASGARAAYQITEFSSGLTANSSPNGIAAGPDGNLWFTEEVGNRIGRITPAGGVTEFSVGLSASAFPYSIAAGPDGNLWFTENNGDRIGRITPAGAITEFSVGLSAGGSPKGIAA